MRQPKRILVAPLNWGLGHATRCIPIIHELLAQGAAVFIASDGRALQLLKKEFPHLPALELPGYGVEYRSSNLISNMLREMPGMIRAVYLENRRVQKFINVHQLDGIISDNRMGCSSKKVPCIFITHQIDLIIPSRLLQWFARRMNYHYINKFSECWVPDVGGEPNLSGHLSHGTPLDRKIKFIGALSRMKVFPIEKKYDVIAVISGPEPQRTKLEKAFIQQAKKLPHSFLIVQGKPEQDEHFFIKSDVHPFEKNIEIISYLTSEALNEAILASDLFVGRSGYSSVMDLAKLGKAALFIPTPGQTEQEYLSGLYAQSGIFHSQKHAGFDLKKGMEAALRQSGLNGNFFTEKKMKNVVQDFLESCHY